MSEEIGGAAVSESAPSSTSEIASQVISSAENESIGGDESSSVQGYEAPTTPAAVQPEPELSPAAKFLLAQGHKSKKEDGRPVWLPYGTIEKMLDRYKDQHQTEWTGARTQIERERDEIRGQLDTFKQMLSGDERAFLGEVAKIDPRYARFLQEQRQEQARPQPSSEQPGPDVPLPDGSRTYSVEGLQKLIDWAVDAKLMPKVDERLKPITDREQALKQETEQRQLEQTHRTRVSQSLQEAQSWPGFGTLAPDGTLTETQSAVLAELRSDADAAKAAGQRPQMTLRQAYLEVMAKSQDPDAMRAKILKEVAVAPKAPSLSRTGADSTRSVARSTADIARSVIQQAGE